MKFVPKDIEGNVNVSKKPPLQEFFKLLAGLIVLIVSIYIFLGLAVSLIVPILPHSVEQVMGNSYLRMFGKPSSDLHRKWELQEIVNKLKAGTPLQDYAYTVHIVSSSMINAMAVPGGNIVVFSGLLDEIESEQEIIFVLAHELGHFAHRDHLKAVGRNLVFITLATVFFGGDSVARLVQNILTTTEYGFSKYQETKADRWALDAMSAAFGSVIGATDFFERLKTGNKLSRFAYFFSTHPFPETRISDLEEHIQKNNYRSS